MKPLSNSAALLADVIKAHLQDSTTEQKCILFSVALAFAHKANIDIAKFLKSCEVEK